MRILIQSCVLQQTYSARYPKGTFIELVEPLEDPYAPKPVGSRFREDCVDDAL